MAGVCRFFLKGNCQYGDRCKFQHPITQQPSRTDRKNVCRFFLEGNCKFGDKCRYYHPKQEQYGGQRNQAPPIDTGNQRSQGGRNRFELYTSQDTIDGGGHRRGEDHRPHQNRGGGQRSDYQQDNRTHRQQDSWSHRADQNSQYKWQSPDYRSRDQGQQSHDQRQQPHDQRQQSHDQRQQSHDQRQQPHDQRQQPHDQRQQPHDQRHQPHDQRHQPHDQRHQPHDQRQQPHDQRQQSHRQWEDRREGQGQHYGGPVGQRQRLFSQDDNKTSSHPTDPSEIAALIRKDVEASKGMWSLSCYSYDKAAPCVPGLLEVSPEELRLLVYMANSSGNTVALLQNLEEVCKKQTALNDLYANITTEEVNKLLSLPPQPSGSDWTSGLFGPVSTTSSDVTISSVFSTRTTAPLLLGGANPPLFNTQANTQSSIFPTSLSSPTAMNPVQSHTASVPSAPRATPIQDQAVSKLTQEDLEAFKANKFVLGKIPEAAPPPDLC